MSKKGFVPIVAIIIGVLAIGAGFIVHQFLETRNEAITTLTSITSTTLLISSVTLPTPPATIAPSSVPPTTPSQKAKMFECGDSVTFTYKGAPVTYGTVLHNSVCWLDRNLGASQVATSQTDANAYGDLFQWGRLDDGHQTRTSGTTTVLSSTDNPGHSNFIITKDKPFDWRSPQNDNLWQGVGGINNPCPTGWRLPTSAEWDTERLSWSADDSYGAYASPLKLTLAGNRDYSDSAATLSGVGGLSDYWSSTVSGSGAYGLAFYSSGAFMSDYSRANGFSVRCLKN